MQTVHLSKCRQCGAPYPEGAGICSACGAKLVPPAPAGKSGGAKLHSVPKQALDPKALLAKIDSLDWDPTTTLDTPSPLATSPPPSWRLLLLPVLAGLIILLVGAALLLIWSSHEEAAVMRPTIVVETPPPPVQPPVPESTASTEIAPDAADLEREAERAKALQAAEDAAKRRADKKRKTAAEQQALLEEQERQRRAEDERHQRLEREAAEARARAAAVPPPPAKPASVRELCAKEDGAFARNGCEARACSLPEWRASEYCRQRWQEQMRTLNTP